MNAKSIYEVLTALGAGVLVAGCNTAPNPKGGSEIVPVAEVFTATTPAKAPIVNAQPANTVDSAANPANPVAPTVAVAAIPTATPTPAPTPAPTARTKSAAELPTTPAPITREAAVTTPTSVALATPVQPPKAAQTTTTTPKTVKKGDTEMKCGQGACG